MYITNLPLSHYKNTYIAARFNSIDLSYKVSSHSALVGYLLDQCNKKIKSKFDSRLQTPQFLNSYIYESKNICKDKVINFLTHVPQACGTKKERFYIYSKSNIAKTIDAKTNAIWLISPIPKATEKKL